MEQRRVLDRAVIKLQFPQQAGDFLRNVCYPVKTAVAQGVSQSARERFALTVCSTIIHSITGCAAELSVA
jgi:hypothetical protein